MKELHFIVEGKPCKVVSDFIEKFEGKLFTKNTFFSALDILDFNEAHGNITGHSGWFAPKNGDNTFYVEFKEIEK